MSNYNRTMTQAHWKLSDATNGNMHSGLFEDPSFPTDTSSLYWNMQTKYSGRAIQTYQYYDKKYGIGWKRPSEIVKKGTSPNLWGTHGISVQVSEQGSLGDCWFLSTASALAEVPGRIKKIFNK
jgi:hypothetical protein